MDSAIWITWYNLTAEGRDVYLSWMHGVYIPGLMKNSAFLWAAHYESLPKEQKAPSGRIKLPANALGADMPTGDRYIFLVGAGHANLFSDPVPSAMHQAMPVPRLMHAPGSAKSCP